MSAVWWIAGVAAVVVAGGVALSVARAGAAVETPAYAVEVSDGDFELRRYPALAVATVRMSGDRGAAVRAGFGPLARYIFARDRGGEKIAMTAPVTQTPEKIAMTAPVTQGPARGGGWTIAFIMPQGRSLADLPAPAGDVRLEEIPPRRVAALRFSGRWSDANFARAAERLMARVAAAGLVARGPVEYAYYNDPFTPFFLRRNEVMVEVAD